MSEPMHETSGDRKISVLDHGYVRLVDHMGSDLSIVRAARVSYDAAWRAGENTGSDQRLINYLMKNQHTTPFESVTFTFEVKAPIFVFRQWHRHRTWSFNEVSARYTALPEEFYVPALYLIGTQSVSSKQSRDINLTTSPNDYRTVREMEVHGRHAFELYYNMLDRGVPRELARSILPLSTYSHMFATVNLHNLFRFLALRLHSHAQYEIRVYAEAMSKLIKGVVPVASEAFTNHFINNKQGELI